LAFILDHIFSKKNMDDDFLESLAGTTPVPSYFRETMKNMQKNLKKGWDKLPDADKQTWASWTAMRQDICGTVMACTFYLFVFGAGAYGLGYALDQHFEQDQDVEDCKHQCKPLQIRQGLVDDVDHTWDNEKLGDELFDDMLPPVNADNCWDEFLRLDRDAEGDHTRGCIDYCEWCNDLDEGFRKNFVTGFSDPFRMAGETAGFAGGIVADVGVQAGTPFLNTMTGMFGDLMTELFGGMGILALVLIVVFVLVVASSFS
jgi:hypothetical protein